MAPEKKHKRPVGAGLALDKFASLGVSKFDKRKKLERIQKQKLIKHSKYKKLKHKLEAQGILSGAPVKDAVAELENLDANTLSDPDKVSDIAKDDVDHGSRARSHARAGPSSKAQAPAQEEPRNRPQVATAAATCPNANRTRQGTPDVAGPIQRPQAPAAAGQPGVPTCQSSKAQGYQPVKARKADNRKRSFGDSEEVGTHEAPCWLKIHGGVKGTDQPAGRVTEGRVDRGLKASSGGTQRSGPGATGGKSLPKDAAPGPLHGVALRESGKKLSRLQRLAQQVADEKAAKQRAKEQAMKEREERMKKVAAVEKARKEQKHLHFKRTAKGQPLMRYRMEKLLSQLQDTA